MGCDINTWRPLQGERGHYACECGTTGWRASDGRIHAHRQRPQRMPWPSWSLAGHADVDIAGRVIPLPSLDETERRR